MMRRHRQLPSQWLITDERLGDQLPPALRRLPHGSGVLIRHHELKPRERERLARKARSLAGSRRLLVLDEVAGRIARVHNAREIRQAQLRGVLVMFLSPMHRTRSHPDWKPIPRMRAAALVRLARVPMIALGGMNPRRFARLKALGFQGWAGIDAWVPN
jgi:thiamine-phosphate pyrophosphorylase